MVPEQAMRGVLARSFARRHGRDVPFAELAVEAEREGLEAGQAWPALRALVARHQAIETPRGWRPAAAPLATRAHEPAPARPPPERAV